MCILAALQMCGLGLHVDDLSPFSFSLVEIVHTDRTMRLHSNLVSRMPIASLVLGSELAHYVSAGSVAFALKSALRAASVQPERMCRLAADDLIRHRRDKH